MVAATDMHAAMMQASTAYRLQHSNVRIDGTVALDFNAYPYIPALIDEHAPRITVLKGAQMGFTIACIMRALEEAKQGNLRGVGYMFPTEGEVSDFAKARFGPMMTNNHELWGRYVKDTDSAALKRVGDTFLYFRGVGQRGSGSTNKSTSKLKSIPLDRLYLDERDEMDDARVDAVMHRLDGSNVDGVLGGEVFCLSTPTLPGYGVDLDYRTSNQSVWMWQCRKCNHWTCLELTYPDCIVEPGPDRDPYYQCEKCHAELDRVKGEWVARKQDVSDHLGFWVSQLASPTKTARDVILAAEQAIETGRRREFENQTLARAYADVDEELTREQLEALVDPDELKPLREEGPCAMGVDPGKPHWYVVHKRVTERDSICLDWGRADTYEELDRIARKYNVESGVMDQGYDPSAVAKFVEDHDGWYGGLYVGRKTTDPDWDHRNHVVKLGRTRTLDAAHARIINKRVRYRQKDEAWEKFFVPQMTNLKRATIENDKTGDREAMWIVTGGQKNDHLRHADAYANIALERAPIAKSVRRMERDYRAQSKQRSPRRRSYMSL